MKKSFSPLKTKRLTLDLATAQDISDLIYFLNKNKSFFQPWDPTTPPKFYERNYWKEKIRLYNQEYQSEKALRLLIKNNLNIIGMINFTNFEKEPFQNVRLGYKIDKDYQGQGYMLEALRISIAYIFTTLHYHRIEANVIPSNTRSRNLLKKLGFIEHGLAPNYLKINGKWQDHILTSLTIEQYNSAH